MKIIVCFKYIRDESDISVNPDRTVKLDNASWVISPYDLNAMEAGMQLAKASENSTVSVLTIAGEALDNSKMKKAVLSRGPEKLYGVKSDACGGLYATATLLKQAIERIGDVDLVLCGEGSGDLYSQQLGNLLGALMEWPTFNAVDALSLENDTLLVRRSNGERVEQLKVKGPAVVSVTSDICLPHIPSLKDIMAAGKKPVEIWDKTEFSATSEQTETVSILAPERTERAKNIYRETDSDGLEQFVKEMKKYL